MKYTENYASYFIKEDVSEMNNDLFLHLIEDIILHEMYVISTLDELLLEDLNEEEILLYENLLSYISERAGGVGAIRKPVLSKIANRLKSIQARTRKGVEDAAKKVAAKSKKTGKSFSGSLSGAYSNIKNKTGKAGDFVPVKKRISKKHLAIAGAAAATAAYAHGKKYKDKETRKDIVENYSDIIIDSILERIVKERNTMKYILEYEKFKKASTFKDDMDFLVKDMEQIGSIRHEVIDNDSRKFVILTDDMDLAQEIYDTLATDKQTYKIKTVEIKDINKIYISLMTLEELEKEKDRIIKSRKEKEETQKMMTGMAPPEEPLPDNLPQ